jgi:hypothetical protein
MGFAKLASGRRPKMLSAVLVLNPDTSEDLRDSAERPAGLTNLGATCLQTAYFSAYTIITTSLLFPSKLGYVRDEITHEKKVIK